MMFNINIGQNTKVSNQNAALCVCWFHATDHIRLRQCLPAQHQQT